MTKIRLLLMDCDGVLTDGRLYYSSGGEEMKAFHVRDGQGIAEWHRFGNRSGIISGRRSEAVERRARELGIEFVFQGVTDKVNALSEILAASGISPEDVIFIGDDVPDIEIMQASGFAIAVGDAAEDVKLVADLVTKANGGCGAVREAIDRLLSEEVL